MKKKREREKETSRNRSERILHAVQVQRSPTAPQGSSPQREREKEKEESKTILSIDIDEKRITYLKYTREHVTSSYPSHGKVFSRLPNVIPLFHSSGNDSFYPYVTAGNNGNCQQDKISKLIDTLQNFTFFSNDYIFHISSIPYAPSLYIYINCIHQSSPPKYPS